MIRFDVRSHINPPETSRSYDFTKFKILDLTVIKPNLIWHITNVENQKTIQKYIDFLFSFQDDSDNNNYN
mgnify:CR=1 FL=1